MGSDSDNSSGGKKTIKINQDFFSLSGGRKKRGRSKTAKKKRREKPEDNSKTSKKMRKEFFKKIRSLQEKRRTENTSTNKDLIGEKDKSGFNKAFDESLSFLSDYVQDKKEKRRKKKKKTLKREKEQLQISLEVPPNLSSAANKPPAVSYDNESVQVITDTPQIKVSMAKKTPKYSSMKNGTFPTYRQFIRNQTMKKERSSQPNITIQDKPIPKINHRSAKLEKIKASFKQDTDSGKKKKRVMKVKKSTKTIKRKLGKVEGTRKVSVLIKSRDTRKNVQTEKIRLSQVSVIEIKKYLKDKNLIKTGTKAPNDVLRKMYEQCILAGDLTNKSDGVLLHNYISND